MSVGLLHRRSMMQAAGGGGSYNYITDGLAFHLDGVDATTAQWVDRIGGITFTMNNVTLDGNGGVVFNGTDSYGNYPNTLGYAPDTCSIEVVADIVSMPASTVLFMQNANNLLAFGFPLQNQIISSTGTTLQRLFTFSGSVAVGKKTASCVWDKIYINRDNRMIGEDKGYWEIRSGGTFIGGRTASQNLLNGVIYQIRIYNRLLTEAEILANQAIDMARYNIS